MKILVINGTGVKGCTYRIKEYFLDEVRSDNEITEIYLPKDMPEFCCGCKNCFFKGADKCPNAGYMMPIWDAIVEADLILFTYPVYALRAPASIKTVLDHLCVRWMVHRPEREMFNKRVAVLTNAIGVFNGSAQKDVVTSANWMGISDVKKLGFGLMEGVNWDELSAERRNKFEKKTRAFARECTKPVKNGMSLKVKTLFAMCRLMHKNTYKEELKKEAVSLDNQHWVDNGWFK